MTVCARSDVGRVRTNNEDAFAVTDLDTGARLESGDAQASFDVQQQGILLVVSDGMGGHAAGEVASALVVDSMRKSLAGRGLDEAGAETTSMQRLIDNAVKRANADVFEAGRAARKRGMGATLTAVLVHFGEAYVAEVGDSRAYLLRAGRLRQITKDQSFVQLLLDSGALTPEEARASDAKNLLLQGMGLEADVTVSIGRLHLRRGDRLLVCCDGLSNLVSDAELRELLGGPDLPTACNRMVDLANERGGDDNITAILAVLEGDGLPLQPEDETVTETLEVLQAYKPKKTPSNRRMAASVKTTATPIQTPARPIEPISAAITTAASSTRSAADAAMRMRATIKTTAPRPEPATRPAKGAPPWLLFAGLAGVALVGLALALWWLR